MKIGIITFHASHNYGSVLQAYALQKYLSKLGYENEIINFRSEAQKEVYRPLTKRKGIKYILKNAFFLLHYKSRKERYDKFEAFIEKRMNKSEKEYTSIDSLKNEEFSYDVFISGSDQIWNTAPADASMAYFLPFVKEGKRVAYAPSFGQLGTMEKADEISSYLCKYDRLSIREKYGQQLIFELTGKKVPILVDPTVLLLPDEWNSLEDRKPIINSRYIFFYTLFADKEMIKMVKTVSKILGLPVVVSNITNQHDIVSGFRRIISSGPEDFLNLIKNAEFVCTSSFHGTVFSLLYHKLFISIRGMSDNRISTLLECSGLTSRAINSIDELLSYEELMNIDYTGVNTAFDKKREEAKDYLLSAFQ